MKLAMLSWATPITASRMANTSPEACARLMIAAALSHSHTNPKPGSVAFVLRDEQAFRSFVEALRSVPESNA